MSMTFEELNREIASKSDRLELRDSEHYNHVWKWYTSEDGPGGFVLPEAAEIWRQAFTGHIMDRTGAGLSTMLKTIEEGVEIEFDSLNEEIEVLLDEAFKLEPGDLSEEALSTVKAAFLADLERRAPEDS